MHVTTSLSFNENVSWVLPALLLSGIKIFFIENQAIQSDFQALVFNAGVYLVHDDFTNRGSVYQNTRVTVFIVVSSSGATQLAS